jgi:NAD(P)H-hydrate repair Nnr-like enzyme with NAD(P)H-hydrate epimerase domain
MDDLSGSGDPGVDAFVDASISSFAAWDVVLYFQHDPETNAECSQLARRLGRKDHEIERVLRSFTEQGVLVASDGTSGATRYSLSGDPAVRGVVSRFVELAKVREVRLEFVRRVLAHVSLG